MSRAARSGSPILSPPSELADLPARYLNRLLPWSGRCVWQGTCSYGPVDTAIALLYRALGDRESALRHAALARGSATRLDARPFLEELHSLGLTE
ncbi:MAG: hypothetical protein ACK5LO_07285 [Leucobacter sp.]